MKQRYLKIPSRTHAFWGSYLCAENSSWKTHVLWAVSTDRYLKKKNLLFLLHLTIWNIPKYATLATLTLKTHGKHILAMKYDNTITLLSLIFTLGLQKKRWYTTFKVFSILLPVSMPQWIDHCPMTMLTISSLIPVEGTWLVFPSQVLARGS